MLDFWSTLAMTACRGEYTNLSKEISEAASDSHVKYWMFDSLWPPLHAEASTQTCPKRPMRQNLTRKPRPQSKRRTTAIQMLPAGGTRGPWMGPLRVRRASTTSPLWPSSLLTRLVTLLRWVTPVYHRLPWVTTDYNRWLQVTPGCDRLKRKTACYRQQPEMMQQVAREYTGL